MKQKRLWMLGVVLLGASIFILVHTGDRVNAYFSAVKLQFLTKYAQSYYLYDIDEEAGFEEIYDGYLDGLENSMTYYLEKEDLKAAKIQFEGEYFGTGLKLMWSMESHALTIVDVVKGSMAEEKGLQIGDLITEIDKVPVLPANGQQLIRKATSNIEDIVDVVKGSMAEEKGLQIGDLITEIDKVPVLPANGQQLIRKATSNIEELTEYVIKRDNYSWKVELMPTKVAIEDVTWELLDDVLYIKLHTIKEGTLTEYVIKRDNYSWKVELMPTKVAIEDVTWELLDDVLYIKLHTIKEGTSAKVNKIIEATDFNECKGLILDVRNLMTHQIEEVAKISDLFLDSGLAFKVKTKAYGIRDFEMSEGAYEMPMVIITNSETLGGVEALVLALKERATLLGSNTGGLHYVQNIISFEDETGMSVASGKICDRYGKELDQDGIVPNIRLYLDEKELINEDDYLQHALTLF